MLQTLTLWSEIATDMFRLWCLAEADMLREGGGYRLCDTGQGLNRVQGAPAVARAMAGVLARCQVRRALAVVLFVGVALFGRFFAVRRVLG